MHHRTFHELWEDAMRRKITAFISSLRPDDLAGIGPITEKTQYRGQGRSSRKGGSPPKDYLAVEALIDLREALSRNIYEALPHYYWLKRVLNR